MSELLLLKTSSGRSVRIVEEIGPFYRQLGVLLLNDKTGVVTKVITQRHPNDVDAISVEILRRWLEGQGQHPVTWSTLIRVLKDVQLAELAQTIQEALTSSAQPFGETVTYSAHCVSHGTPPPHSLCIVPASVAMFSHQSLCILVV